MEEKQTLGKNTFSTDTSINQMVHIYGQLQTKSSLACEPISQKKMKLKNHSGNWKQWNKDLKLLKKSSTNSESSNHEQKSMTALLQCECSEEFWTPLLLWKSSPTLRNLSLLKTCIEKMEPFTDTDGFQRLSSTIKSTEPPDPRKTKTAEEITTIETETSDKLYRKEMNALLGTLQRLHLTGTQTQWTLTL